MYRQNGLLSNGRLGAWNLGLGAEWAAFDSDIDGTEIDNDSYKVLFDGDLLIAPGALPFRLHAYSYDTTSIRTYEDNAPDLPRTSYIRPGIATDLQNGQTVVSGIQFVGGIRNGSYLGKYRETLSKLPRLLLDYRDTYHRDVDKINPTKYRRRDLAFVSLNKKDNWFHYRVYDYKDYINSRYDEREETFLLGTIDHMLKRKWIQLTNWMKISADGSYTVDDGKDTFGETDRYDLNLFSIMQRRGATLSNFTHYSRERKGNYLSQYLDIPVYANKRISPDKNLRGQLIVNRWQDQIDSKVREEEDVYYSTAKYETNITKRTKIDYGFEAEYNTRKHEDGQGLLAEVEAYSNRLRGNRLDWYGNLGLGHYYGEGIKGDDTDFTEGFGAGRVTYHLKSNLSLQGSQELVYGSGSIGSYTTSYLVPRSTRGFKYTDGEVAREDDYVRTQTGMSLEHIGRNRISNRIAGLYKYEEDSQTSNWSFELEHRLSYNDRAFNVLMTNQFTTGEFVDKGPGGTTSLGSLQEISSIDDLFEHYSQVRYRPNKYWETELNADVQWRSGKTGYSGGKDNTTLVLLTQRMRRNFYAVNGIVRKLADIEQRIDYDKFSGLTDREMLAFTLAGNYYPTKTLSFGGRFEYRYYDPGVNRMLLNLSSSLYFPKFQIDFEYDYGTDEDQEVVVQRYEVNVRKTF
jgi:hypothetical protein